MYGDLPQFLRAGRSRKPRWSQADRRSGRSRWAVRYFVGAMAVNLPVWASAVPVFS